MKSKPTDIKSQNPLQPSHRSPATPSTAEGEEKSLGFLGSVRGRRAEHGLLAVWVFGLVRGKRIFDFWWRELKEGMQHGRREGCLLAWVEGKLEKEKKREKGICGMRGWGLKN